MCGFRTGRRISDVVTGGMGWTAEEFCRQLQLSAESARYAHRRTHGPGGICQASQRVPQVTPGIGPQDVTLVRKHWGTIGTSGGKQALVPGSWEGVRKRPRDKHPQPEAGNGSPTRPHGPPRRHCDLLSAVWSLGPEKVPDAQEVTGSEDGHFTSSAEGGGLSQGPHRASRPLPPATPLSKSALASSGAASGKPGPMSSWAKQVCRWQEAVSSAGWGWRSLRARQVLPACRPVRQWGRGSACPPAT